MMMALSPEQHTLLNDLMNQFFNAGAKGMGMMMGIDLELNKLDIHPHSSWEEFKNPFEQDEPVLGETTFRKQLGDPLLMIMKGVQGSILADLMLGGTGVPSGEALSDMQVSALGEALNQMVSGGVQSLNERLMTPLEMAHTEAHLYTTESIETFNQAFQTQTFYALQGVWIMHDGSGITEKIEFVALLTEASAETLVKLNVNNPSVQVEPTKAVASTAATSTLVEQGIASQEGVYATAGVLTQDASTTHDENSPSPYQGGYNSGGGGSYVASAPAFAAPPHQNPTGTSTPNMPYPPPAMPSVQPISYGAFDAHGTYVQGNQQENMGLLMDINLNLHVELGRTQLSIKNILELTRGSVVELDKVAGEAVDLYANGKLIARGEVVVIEDNFGLRVTSIVSPAERLKGL
jgi:flagellar motor switch protein FliN/FliY